MLGPFLTLGHSSDTKQSVTWREWVCPKEWLSWTIPHPGPFLRHQTRCSLERMSLPSRSNCPDHSPPWAIPLTLKCNLERMYNPQGMFVLHQPPKRTILRNCSQLWTLKEWLPGEADHSTWPLHIVTAKKNNCPRPLPIMGSRCLWYISNQSTSHVNYNGKPLSVRNLNPLSKQESICPIWTLTKINNIFNSPS